MTHISQIALCAAAAATLAGCGMAREVGQIGKLPELSPMAPVAAPPSPYAVAAVPAGAAAASTGSLYQAGGGLFADRRARNVGDLLTIRVTVDDQAALNNSTQRQRQGNNSGGFSGLFGLEKLVGGLLGLDTNNLVGMASKSGMTGNGTIKRQESISMTLAAVVTQVLPNGTMVVRGSQEMRVNNELRELIVMGLAQPHDVVADNSLPHDRIAELRMSYGGRGHLSSAQQARWGQQLAEIVSPF